MPKWPKFDAQTVVGWNVLDLIDWVSMSEGVLSGATPPDAMPIIALPPMQRSAVWRAKQVLDLWDSLMRGLPIGTIYLVENRAGGWKAVSEGRTVRVNSRGFELLDGQQRVRALLVGVRGPSTQEQRCLWVDLGAEIAAQRPCLRITSKSQPFGYDSKDGGKLPLAQRRDARNKIEPDQRQHPLRLSGRSAYDFELFDEPVTQDGHRICPQPPRPHKSSQHTFELHRLLAAWRKGSVTSLQGVAEGAPEEALNVLNKAFYKIQHAKVALLRVDPSTTSEDRLELYEG